MGQRIRITNEIKFLIVTLVILILISIGYAIYYIQQQLFIKAAISGIHIIIGVVVLPILMKGRGSLVLVRFVLGLILFTGIISMISSNFQSGTELSWFIPIPLYYFAATGYKQGLKWNIFSYTLLLFYYLWIKMLNPSLQIESGLNMNTVVSNFVVFITSGYFAYRVESTHSNLEEQASRDSLTGVLNRVGFRYLVESLINSKREKDNHVFSLLLIDLDHFKSINDNYGHIIGDKLLVKFVNLLKSNIRNSDLLARWGGEEFIIIFNGLTLTEARIISEKLRKIIEKENFIFPEFSIKITASFGLTEYNHAQSFEYIFDAADKALYYSKRNGRNTVNCYMEPVGIVQNIN